MKTIPRLHCAVLAPALWLTLGLVERLPAQTFKVLHNFATTSGSSHTNSDGAQPYGRLVPSGNTLFGVAAGGGNGGNGTVFKVDTDGSGFTTLYSFTGSSDGAAPTGGLVLISNMLYGTTSGYGIIEGPGTVFAMDTNGTSFGSLYNFTPLSSPPCPCINGDGANPLAGPLLVGNILYGTANDGGSFDAGTVYAVNTDGTGFTNLYNYTGGSDGEEPSGGLILSGGTLYGTAHNGGSGTFAGTVFAINTDGTGFRVLHGFSDWVATSGTNADGSLPVTGLILAGGTLYGTTELGGLGASGTVFAVNTAGTDFRTLYSFTPLYPLGLLNTNTDGGRPQGGLARSVTTLYGTGNVGGSGGVGTVFALNTDGTGFRVLYSFSQLSDPASGRGTNSDGANPYADLILSGNTLYGSTVAGGSGGNGTIFSITFTPQLAITRSETNMVLSWPTNYAGFDYTGYTLQSTTNLGPSATWSTNSPAPVVVNGQNTVTNSLSGAQQFFRLAWCF